jgi:hypothetical protein
MEKILIENKCLKFFFCTIERQYFNTILIIHIKKMIKYLKLFLSTVVHTIVIKCAVIL